MLANQNNFKLFVDGAARNNPGPAGAGIYIKKNENYLCSNGFFLGSKTNNQAEYLALIIGILIIRKYIKETDFIEILCDSQLIVNQIAGHYKIKNIDLKKMHSLAMAILENMNYKIDFIPREQNQEADREANHAIDKKKQLPKEFISFLENNEICSFS
jgi:ribonuclease HI